jgi:hypothetical protein
MERSNHNKTINQECMNVINKQIVISGTTVLVGLGLLSFALWGQPPVSRDPNIGAGILFLLGIAVAAGGIVWLVVEIIKAERQ